MKSPKAAKGKRRPRRPRRIQRSRLLAKTPIGRLIAKAKLTDGDIATALAISRSAVANKVACRRTWRVHDIEALLPLLSERLRRPVSFEDVLSSPDRPRRGAAA